MKKLSTKQKKFILKNYPKRSQKKIAQQLKISISDVRHYLEEHKDNRAVTGQPKTARISEKIEKLADSYLYGFLFVAILSLVFRMIHLWEVWGTPFFEHLHTDPLMYHKWAVEIVKGDFLGKNQPIFYLGPLYPYFLAVVYILTEPSPLFACLMQVVLSTLSSCMIFHLGHRMFGPKAGLTAGLLAATYGMFIFYSSLLLGVTLIVFLNLVMLVCLVEGLKNPRWWKWVLAGICCGLSAGARGTVILFMPFSLFAFFLYFGWREWRSWLTAGVLFLSATIVLISPLAMHNWYMGDDVVLLTSNAGANLYIGNNLHSDGIYIRNARYRGRPMGLSVREQQANFPEVARKETGNSDLKPSEISDFWIKKTGEEIRKDPGRWFKLIGNKVRYFFNAYEVPNNRNYYFSKRFSFLLNVPLVTFGAVLPFALLGMIVLRRSWRHHALFYGFFFAHFIALITFFVNGRYRLVVVPVLLLYAAVSFQWIYLQMRQKKFLSLVISAVGILLLYSITYSSVPRIGYRANYYNLGNAYRDLGQPEKALACYDESVKISRTFYHGYFNKGKLLAQLGRSEEARTVLNKALKLARDNNDTLNIQRIQRQLRALED
jgi:4-amino-4-deoxy-L-arabinose transferase-like glycosyltransferase